MCFIDCRTLSLVDKLEFFPLRDDIYSTCCLTCWHRLICWLDLWVEGRRTLRNKKRKIIKYKGVRFPPNFQVCLQCPCYFSCFFLYIGLIWNIYICFFCSVGYTKIGNAFAVQMHDWISCLLIWDAYLQPLQSQNFWYQHWYNLKVNNDRWNSSSLYILVKHLLIYVYASLSKFK